MDAAEVVEVQSTIISIQSKVINELFKLLANYITLEELDNLPVVETINKAAGLRRKLMD